MNKTSIDKTLVTLHENKNRWLTIPLAQKRAYLEEMVQIVPHIAPEWARLANEVKQIPAGSSAASEEWLSGPWATLHWLQSMIKTLKGLEAGQAGQLDPKVVRTRANGQVVVDVLPLKIYDHVLLGGLSAEVWMQPEVTRDNLLDNTASIYCNPPEQGSVALVLGAGNISSIPILDVLYKLYGNMQVTILKMSPVNDYLLGCFEKLFAPLIHEGFVAVTTGGGDVGAYLTEHQQIDTIHITGSVNTLNRIIFGDGSEAEERKSNQNPRLQKHVTAELGNNSPTIVVPGPWESADIIYQAEHLAVQKYWNVGYNCLATQVLVMPAEWELSDKLMDELRGFVKSLPNRHSYFPLTDERHHKFLDYFPNAETYDDSNGEYLPRVIVPNIDPSDSENPFFTSEVFCNILGETRLPGKTAAEYLRNAVDFCNNKLHGSLAINMIIHPKTIKELGSQFEEFLADLKYGGIGVNVWTGGNFLLSQATWGAYPGETIYNLRSGIGVVHNSFLFDKPQKTITYGGFYPFPRAWLKGEFHLLPKPVWFLDHSHALTVSQKIVDFEANPRWWKLGSLVLNALQN